jgi:hypothetical protein
VDDGNGSPVGATRRDVRARPTQGRVAPAKGNAKLPKRPRDVTYICLVLRSSTERTALTLQAALIHEKNDCQNEYQNQGSCGEDRLAVDVWLCQRRYNANDQDDAGKNTR